MSSFTKSKIETFIRSGLLEITPFEHYNVQCNSYDFRLDPEFRSTAHLTSEDILDTKEDLSLPLLRMSEDGLVIQPGILYLMSTLEFFSLPDFVEGFIDGRSTLARYGISTHLTSGNIKPGFKGKITLEVTCIVPVKIYPKMKFGQVMFCTTDGPASSYVGKYQNQNSPQNPVSLYLEDF